jgi:hypothetical protein
MSTLGSFPGVSLTSHVCRALEALQDKSFVTLGSKTSFEGYLEDLRRHRFVLCPQGNGLDTHRMWEALLMGAVPVAPHSTLDALYTGLPVLLVDDWDFIDEDLLRQTWEQYSERLPGGVPLEQLMADAWLSKINSTIAQTDTRTDIGL